MFMLKLTYFLILKRKTFALQFKGTIIDMIFPTKLYIKFHGTILILILNHFLRTHSLVVSDLCAWKPKVPGLSPTATYG